MIGERYWSTGITVRFGYSGGGQDGWSAGIKFYDDGFAEDESTQGALTTRYFIRGEGGLATAIDILKADAERLGIHFTPSDDSTPGLWYTDSEDYPAPKGWHQQLQEQAARIGWRTHRSPETIDAIAKATEQAKGGVAQ